MQVETELPELSVAVYVTVVLPMGKSAPESKSEDSVTEPELSEAVGSVHVTVAVATPLSVVTSWDGGQPEIVGFSLSEAGKISNNILKISYLSRKGKLVCWLLYHIMGKLFSGTDCSNLLGTFLA